MILPGIVLSWLFIIFPFLVWDSLKDDWIPEFKGDIEIYFRGIKNKIKEIG